jgi:SAM-dependent methyltransferase
MSQTSPAAPVREAFACPSCRTSLQLTAVDCLRCPREGSTFEQRDGIWRLLRPTRERAYTRFIEEYETVRRQEGRRLPDSTYRNLPYRGFSSADPVDWRIRMKGYETLLYKIIQPLEENLQGPLSILDLGSGNGWLSNRLAERGHALAAIDLVCNDWDGLGAYIHYETSFERVQAEFDALPFLDGSLDLTIFNASLHYSPNYETTLSEALRVLRPGGELVVLDSPLYRESRSGQQMVLEREADFTRRYGFPSNTLGSENFLSEPRLEALARSLGIRWSRWQPCYSLGWELRRLKARLLLRREPARFVLIAARK